MTLFRVTLATTVVLIVSFQEAFALKCWSCNSTQPFCGPKFEKEKISDELLVECRRGPKGGEPVCLKTIHLKFVRRHCVNNEASVEQFCFEGGNQVSVCKHCREDGCNAAAQYGPAATILGILTTFMTFFPLF